MAITNKGEGDFSTMNYLNVPVSIYFGPETNESGDDGPIDGVWEFTANNYMPRKDRITQGHYHLVGPKDELAGLIRKHILPLYLIAAGQIENMCGGKKGSLYFWTDRFDD